MYDRRIARGSTYAAMVIPAGTNPDTMLMERKQEERRRKTMKGSMVSKSVIDMIGLYSITSNLSESRCTFARTCSRQSPHGNLD